MRTLLALTSRELKSLWYSPIAFSVGALFLVLQGVTFAILLLALNDPSADPSWTVSQFFFGGWFLYWISVFLMAPVLTMRTFSEEKRSGSIEFLLTAPVSDAQVVLSKFLGAWIAYCLLWVPTVAYFLVLRSITTVDWGPVATGYLGTWLLGAVLIALGVLASSLTRNQVISAVLGFVLILLLFLSGALATFTHDPDAREFISYFSIYDQLQLFSKGLIDTRPIVFYASLTAFCLFLTGRVIGSPRWRS